MNKINQYLGETVHFFLRLRYTGGSKSNACLFGTVHKKFSHTHFSSSSLVTSQYYLHEGKGKNKYVPVL
jgi:hypothetical protein